MGLRKPFIRKSDDRLICLAQAELILLMLAGNVFQAGRELEEFWVTIVGLLLIVLIIVFAGFALLTLTHAIRKKFNESERGIEFNQKVRDWFYSLPLIKRKAQRSDLKNLRRRSSSFSQKGSDAGLASTHARGESAAQMHRNSTGSNEPMSEQKGVPKGPGMDLYRGIDILWTFSRKFRDTGKTVTCAPRVIYNRNPLQRNQAIIDGTGQQISIQPNPLIMKTEEAEGEQRNSLDDFWAGKTKPTLKKRGEPEVEANPEGPVRSGSVELDGPILPVKEDFGATRGARRNTSTDVADVLARASLGSTDSSSNGSSSNAEENASLQPASPMRMGE